MPEDDPAGGAVARISNLLDALAEVGNDDLIWLDRGRTNADTTAGRRAMAAVARLREGERLLVARFLEISDHGRGALERLLEDEAIKHP